MQLDWLITFIEVSETRNFNRTAENLHITQSTVSSRIRALEKALDTRLFLRGRGGASLTPEGKLFLSHANNIRLTWNLAVQELGRPGTHQATLRISMQMSIWEQTVNEWLSQLRLMFPKTAIHMEADYSKNMLEELQLGNLDIAVLYAPQYKENLEVEHLFDDRFVMVSTKPMHINDVKPKDYVFVALTDYFKARHHELLPHLHPAAISMGLSIVSQTYLKTHGGVTYASHQQAAQLIARNSLYLVEGAPVIEQPVFVSYLSKNRHKLIFSEALNALKEITLI